MSIGKVSDQLKLIEQNQKVTHHSCINRVASGIKQRLEEKVPKLNLRIGQKSVFGTKITLYITGNMETEDSDEMERVKNKVRQIIDSMRNQNNLISLLE